jgi:hypothetical protein
MLSYQVTRANRLREEEEEFQRFKSVASNWEVRPDTNLGSVLANIA